MMMRTVFIATQDKCMAVATELRRWPIPDMISITQCTLHQNTVHGDSGLARCKLARFNWDIRWWRGIYISLRHHFPIWALLTDRGIFSTRGMLSLIIDLILLCIKTWCSLYRSRSSTNQ